MIAFENVDKRFNDVIIMENFNEVYHEHKINCILGPSGCGKTTLLNLLSGIEKANAGYIAVPKMVSYVFQNDSLIAQKTARGNLELVLKSVYRDKKEIKSVIDRFLRMVNMDDAADLYPHEMSGGMRQRLALIRAFAYPSDVLLMDEPFKTLDITLKSSIIDSFLQLYEEDRRTAVFVTHDIDEALLTGDFIYVYSNKPLSLLNKFALNDDRSKRSLYDDGIIKIKEAIYNETKQWMTRSNG